MLREDSEFAARSRSLQPQLGSSPAARGCPARGLRAISFQPNSAVPLAPSRSVPYPYPSPCPSRPRPAAYQRVDVGAGPQAVGAGRAVPPAVRPRPRQQAGAERQQRAAEPQQQRHGAARRRGQTAAAAPRHPPPPAPGLEKAQPTLFQPRSACNSRNSASSRSKSENTATNGCRAGKRSSQTSHRTPRTARASAPASARRCTPGGALTQRSPRDSRRSLGSASLLEPRRRAAGVWSGAEQSAPPEQLQRGRRDGRPAAATGRTEPHRAERSGCDV